MLRIKRTKAGKNGQVAVHYAAAVHPRGTVDAWTRSPAEAALVTDAVAKRVTDRLALAKNAGQLTLERVEATAAQLAAAVAADDKADADAFAKLQAECQSRGARLNEALADNDSLRRQLDEARQDRDAALEAGAKRGKELAAALARVAELEAQASKPAPEPQQPPAPPAPGKKQKQ